jgi:hypothetical protein
VTNAGATREPDGTVRIVISALEPASPGDPPMNWLDTGSRQRGFVVLRWLDNPSPPAVRTTVVQAAAS